MIPSGPLRENLNSLKNYDCVILKDNLKNNSIIKKAIKKVNKEIKIFTSEIKITNLKNINKKNKYLIFSGIGNPESFRNTLLKNKIDVIEEVVFPDHYLYKKADIVKIKNRAKEIGAKIITTEKDFVKISKKDRIGINLVKINLKFINKRNLIKFLKSKINK